MRIIQSSVNRLAIKKDFLVRAIRVAILVGIILNFINNPGLIHLSFDGVNSYRILLTFLVPFFCFILFVNFGKQGKMS